jgi:16S rRNA (cytosine1402-N4)-methyltransferase
MDHTPVFISEIKQYFSSPSYKTIVDCTFGAGGYSKAILEQNKQCRVIAIDRDVNSVSYADKLKTKFGNRFIFINDLFSNIAEIMNKMNTKAVDGFLYDIGVSSMQLDQEARGFSFMKDGPLSMEMGLNNISAYDVVNHYAKEDLANIIYNYGQERYSRKIANAIVMAREKGTISSTLQLANIVTSAIRGKGKIHPATKTFQAIRIEVNQELAELKSSIIQAIKLLNTGGRIGVVTFHSLEDSIVKNIFKNNSSNKVKKGQDRNEMFVNENNADSESEEKTGSLKILTKKPIIPRDNEIKDNIRARSAKLRIADKL